MGSYVEISIGNFDFLQRKNSFGDLLSIFDKKEVIIQESRNEYGEKYLRRYFKTSARNAKMCLDSMGHTIEQARVLFESKKREMLEASNDNLEQFEDEFNFDSWSKAVIKYALVLANDIYVVNDYLQLEKERQKS